MDSRVATIKPKVQRSKGPSVGEDQAKDDLQQLSLQLLQLVRILRKASAPRGQAAKHKWRRKIHLPDMHKAYVERPLAPSIGGCRFLLCVHRSMFLTCGGMRGQSLRFLPRPPHQEECCLV
mmetsp:Transcript_2970/g.7188  ORF Transcript_2970/g.7188 Transcript_2970/m.7188 type:complete len:121 (-) Transcript_2970:2114-2476(-)